ncbi:MAG: hypothetical protein V3T05_09085, partial [Myxococcota bacterium]
MEAITSVLFTDRRKTLLWLRWLHIIALSYLLLFHTGALHLSSQISLIVIVIVASNLVLIWVPRSYFDAVWFEKLLIIADVIVVSMAMS